jgi:succinate dehydrogenase (ubiquinone) cytochrome b560 subunit
MNRITGVILSGGLYIYAIGYLVGPTVGWHFESAVLASGFAAWSVGSKIAAKITLALPFAFHSLNGVRHLAWDIGLGYGKLQVIRTGWFVVGLTALSSLYLTFGY